MRAGTWTADSDQLDARTVRFTLRDTRPLTFSDVVALWCESPQFREFFSATVTSTSFDAFFWETPSVSSLTFGQPFEFVLVESSSLGRLRPDPQPFEEHFRTNPGKAVHTFPNLGGDAMLVVPAPIADASCYPHMARFLRTAPADQVDQFWKAVGMAMKLRISSKPVWLSTAGMGVSWIHLRLDSRPKYYRHQPYTR